MKGRTFGRYRIVESLGEGGMGSVWRAEDDLLGRSVALKLLNARLAGAEGARARFLREARNVGSLEHPGIGTIYDAGEQEGEIYIAMRLVDGGTVADRLATSGVLGMLDALRIAANAADALGHAHGRGILHRDVSPRNIMLTKTGQVIVVDFGLALAEGASRLTQSGTAVGTAHYMAPEIALGGGAGRQSDVYSLGAVLYELLTGTPPFDAERLPAILYAVVHNMPVKPSEKRPGIPPELDRIVLKALSKRPEDRYPSMESFRDALEAVAASGSISQDETTALPVVQPRRRTLSPAVPPTPPAGLGSRIQAFSVSRSFWQRPLAWGIAGFVALGATGLAWWATRPTTSAAPATYGSVAVLPFKNTSERPVDSEHLSEGISQAVINRLSQVSSLRVPPWMTVNRFRDTSEPVEKLASDLHVDSLLVGTFQQMGQRIHGTVSIVDGKSGYQVWADEFDEPLSDIFAVQNRIAMAAATRLLGKLSGVQVDILSVPAAANVEAYELYLKGSLALQKETQAGDERALGYFRRAVAVDSNFASGWAGVGTVLYDMYFYCFAGGLKELDEAEAALRKALELDPSCIAARRALIRVFFERGQNEEALKQGKLIAVSGLRGSEVTIARAEAYLFGGLEDHALPLLQQLIEDDPANPAGPWFMTVAAAWSGHFDEAIKFGERFLAAFGDHPEVRLWLGYSYHARGRKKEAETNYRRALELLPRGSAHYAPIYAAIFLRQTGHVDESDRLMLDLIDTVEDKLEPMPDNYRLRIYAAAAYGLVGDAGRMAEEEKRIRAAMGDAGTSGLPVLIAAIGDQKRYVEMRRAALRAGAFMEFYRNASFLFADPDVERYPGYTALVAEDGAELKRLETLY